MTFNCVGRKENGELYMKFDKPFNIVERIQLLQRSILVNSVAYYELNSNILSDFQYDTNAQQLVSLIREYPEEFKRSRYYPYFYDYCTDDDNVHFTSGFDLMERVRVKDPELYRYLRMDAIMALDLKSKRGVS
jgi:hypothetical protein